ncbi:MAG: N-acetylneuraminate synthase family protein, partial [Pseudomonadota bacterium]|nr:N-acetylneuraminate synthase family protein [Pseudomonadota bacterium]
MKIADRNIGKDAPCYIIAEVSCNHEGNKEEAIRIIKAAAEGGADAVKIQTYTADTISRNFDTRAEGTIWEHLDLHGLYSKAETPWDWSRDLKAYANELGLHFFSSPFDETAVDFLVNEVGVPCLKIASFEVVDTKLLQKCARTGLPIILSNGMTDFAELDEAVRTLKQAGCKDLAILHCNSGYPAAFSEANLK